MTPTRNSHIAQFNRGLIQLKLGDYENGWEGFEWRWQLPEFTPFQCPQPKWTGEDISDKRLLVHTEQGNGDALQYARFLPSVKSKCQKLIIVCIAGLRDLFAAMDCVDEVRLPGSMPADSFDTYCPIMSLSKILGVNLQNLEDRYPYLTVPDHVTVPPLENNNKPRIGICWQGRPTHKNDKHRSCPLDEFVKICSDKYDFVSFQVPVTSEQVAILDQHQIKNLEPDLTDYARSAVFLQQVDLLISVDTSVVHLAGAFNIPTWVMLPRNADWRWQTEGETTPWYSSLRLFRQQELDNWPEFISRLQNELDNHFSTN